MKNEFRNCGKTATIHTVCYSDGRREYKVQCGGSGRIVKQVKSLDAARAIARRYVGLMENVDAEYESTSRTF